MAPTVVFHGPLAQHELADVFRRCSATVLPSLYEGFPLVLVEARACGCRLVATALPAVVAELAPRLGESLELVPLPRMAGVDTPVPADLPAFVDGLTSAVRRTLAQAPLPAAATASSAVEPFTWSAVFRRVEAVWREVLRSPAII